MARFVPKVSNEQQRKTKQIALKLCCYIRNTKPINQQYWVMVAVDPPQKTTHHPKYCQNKLLIQVLRWNLTDPWCSLPASSPSSIILIHNVNQKIVEQHQQYTIQAKKSELECENIKYCRSMALLLLLCNNPIK